MSSNPQVFVETSVQIARLLNSKQERNKIEEQLRQPHFDFITSNYVYMEYQRTVVSDFGHVHSAFLQASNMGEAMQKIFSGSRSYRPRSLVRCGQIAGLIYGEQEVVSLKHATVLLELYLSRLLKRIFWNHLQPVQDAIQCDLVYSGIQRTTDQTFQIADRCRKDTASCFLPDFISDNKTRLKQLSQFLTSNPNVVKNQQRLEQALSNVQLEPRNVLGQGTCWVLGDIIIALQVPKRAALWTGDADFKTICMVLNIEQFVPEVLCR